MKDNLYNVLEMPLGKPCLLGRVPSYLRRDQADALASIAKDNLAVDENLAIETVLKAAIRLSFMRIAKARIKDPILGSLIADFIDIEEIDKAITEFQSYLEHNAYPGNTQISSLKYRIANYFSSLAKAACSSNQNIRLDQVKEEIFCLLKILRKKKIGAMLEIGYGEGGTLLLFMKAAAAHAVIASVGISIKHNKEYIVKRSSEREVLFLEINSHTPAALEQISKFFPDGIDFLFIDGDHSYDGVKQDFQNYSPLVKKGGIIAFHDIIEDYERRYGIVTFSCSGGVPKFWKEIRGNYRNAEFVKDYKQDGAGIGVLFL